MWVQVPCILVQEDRMWGLEDYMWDLVFSDCILALVLHKHCNNPVGLDKMAAWFGKCWHCFGVQSGLVDGCRALERFSLQNLRERRG